MAKELLIIGLIILSLTCINGGSVHTCVHASNKVRKAGKAIGEDGVCMGCDPALKECPAGCQKWVSKLWKNCGHVCLPDGYYFDPSESISGCFEDPDNNQALFIQANRCGCNSASRIGFNYFVLLFAAIISLFFLC